jgi:hypothetical protein
MKRRTRRRYVEGGKGRGKQGEKERGDRDEEENEKAGE